MHWHDQKDILTLLLFFTKIFWIPIIINEIVEVVQIDLILKFQQINVPITFMCSLIIVFLFCISIELGINNNSDLLLPLIVLVLLSCFVELVVMVFKFLFQFFYVIFLPETDQIDSLILVLNSLFVGLRLECLLFLQIKGISTNDAILDESLIV